MVYVLFLRRQVSEKNVPRDLSLMPFIAYAIYRFHRGDAGVV